MAGKRDIDDLHDEMTAWRRDLHAHPEIAFEEHRTAQFVADKLQEFGIDVHRGLGKTGVVGVLTGGHGESGRAIGLRADMDALPISERTNLPYRSTASGKMHACGHDGHTTMLLGAAKYLAKTRNFAGTAYFIFQPAEENEGGGRKMVEDGLFEMFPMDGVYGMHNIPGMPAGQFAVRQGPVMAASDLFEIKIMGRGSHAAMPHDGVDPVLVAAQIVTALQSIASRSTDPLDAVVVSVTQLHCGDTWNVIPEIAVLRGTVRTLRKAVQDATRAAIERIANGISIAHGAEALFDYWEGYPATVNWEGESDIAAQAAALVAGGENVVRDANPSMGAEDFAYMLLEKPGSYVWIGAGEDSAKLHNPQFDFNDDILTIGASYWATLVESQLAAGAETDDDRRSNPPI